jgi:hypothetical protein
VVQDHPREDLEAVVERPRDAQRGRPREVAGVQRELGLEAVLELVQRAVGVRVRGGQDSIPPSSSILASAASVKTVAPSKATLPCSVVRRYVHEPIPTFGSFEKRQTPGSTSSQVLG